MKKGRSMVTLFAMAAALLLAFQGSLTASAAGSTYVIHTDDDSEDWWYQSGSAWDENAEKKELYYLQQEIRDGDLVVVQGNGKPVTFNAHLNNLTVLSGASAVVYANGIDEVFVLSGSVAAVNGNVGTASLYGTAVANFNNNVGTLKVYKEDNLDDFNVNVNVIGTTDYLELRDREGVYYKYYDIQAGKLVIEDGNLKPDPSYYSTTPPEQTVQAAQPQAAAPASQKPASSEYDDVPKTGESTTVYWLLGIAAICLAGRYALRKTF